MLTCCLIFVLALLHQALSASESAAVASAASGRQPSLPRSAVVVVGAEHRAEKKQTPPKLRTVKPKPRITLTFDQVTRQYTEDSEKIPRIVHLTWKDRKLPAWTTQWLRKWTEVNPDWQVWFWSDQAAQEFVKAKFPQHLNMYRQYRSNIQRADAIRWVALVSSITCLQ